MIKRDFKNSNHLQCVDIIWIPLKKKTTPQNEKRKIHSIQETIENLNTDRTFDTIKGFFFLSVIIVLWHVLKMYLLGIPQWSSGQDSVLSLPEPGFNPLLGN